MRNRKGRENRENTLFGKPARTGMQRKGACGENPGKTIFGKLSGEKGESIAETLVALLISSIGLMMLAGMITTGSSLITKSRRIMAAYYEENNRLERKGNQADGTVTMKLSVTDSTDGSRAESFSVQYYKNETIGSKPVISYRYTSGTP